MLIPAIFRAWYVVVHSFLRRIVSNSFPLVSFMNP
jgi:hypothetical protein